MTIWNLTIATIKMVIRNKQTIFFSLFIPVMIMGIFGLLDFEGEGNIPVGIVVDQPNEHTEQFLDQLGGFAVFDITRGTEVEERAALEEGDRTLVLLLPDDLMPDLTTLFGDAEMPPLGSLSTEDGTPISGSFPPPGIPDGLGDVILSNPKTITVLQDPAQVQQTQIAMSILQQILDQVTLQVSGAPELFVLDVQEVSARNLGYLDYLIPGIVAFAVMQMAVFSVAFVFADWREKGILKRLLATPMKPYQLVTANVITRLLIALAQAAILIALGVFAFGINVVGSYWLILLIAILGGVMFLGLGFTISGIAKTVDAVPALANLVVFPMMFLSGTFFPIDTMPVWLQNIVQYFPLTYFADSLRQVMTEGAGLLDVATNLYWMVAWVVVLVGLAIFTFRFTERRDV